METGEGVEICATVDEDFELLKKPIIELGEGIAGGKEDMVLPRTELVRTSDDLETVFCLGGIVGMTCGGKFIGSEEVVRDGGSTEIVF